MKNRNVWLVVLSVIASLLFGSAVLADEPIDGRAGRAELRFLEGMIDHHQMALDMATDCLAKAQTESVTTLCQNIITAQTREILTMRGWLLSWYGIDYQPMAMQHGASTSSGGMMGGDMMGMMSDMMSGMMQGGMMGGQGGGMGMMQQGDMMSSMMSQMSDMMRMMQGGMMGGQDGMMQEGGMMPGDMMGQMADMMGQMSDMMGMMQQGQSGGMGGMDMGAQTGGTAAMPDEHGQHIFSMMGTLTVGRLLEAAADLDPSVPLMDILDNLALSGEFPMGADGMGAMGGMEASAMMGMMAEMNTLTVGDIQEMRGHLDAGDSATMMELMQHHMDVMAGSTADATDHAAHQAAGEVTAESGAETDHAAHHPAGASGSTAATGVVPSDPPMTMGMFAGLSALSGTAYEIAWLEAMIDHHDDALHMAERILEAAPEGVGHEQIRTLAQQIITDQTAEISAMEALITELDA